MGVTIAIVAVAAATGTGTATAETATEIATHGATDLGTRGRVGGRAVKIALIPQRGAPKVPRRRSAIRADSGRMPRVPSRCPARNSRRAAPSRVPAIPLAASEPLVSAPVVNAPVASAAGEAGGGAAA